MKRLLWLTPFLLLAVWITVEGCRTIATPTFPIPLTSTFTITFTPTNTVSGPTNTPTITSTPGAATNTPTPCPALVLSSYTFDTCTQGWSLDATSITTGEIITQSTTTFHTGPGAWQGYIPFTATNNTEEININ